MKSLEQKKKEALKRQEEHNKLSTKQKLTKLDLRVGQNSSYKEREKLASLYQKETQVLVKEDKTDKKHYQKPKRS